jgi:hypothetical protein
LCPLKSLYNIFVASVLADVSSDKSIAIAFVVKRLAPKVE